MNTKHFLGAAALGAAVAAVIVLGSSWLVGSPAGLGGVGQNRFPNSGVSARFLFASTSTNPAAQTDGSLGTTGNLAVTGNGTVGGTFTIGGGTAVTKFQCASASWNPAAVSSTTAATVDVTATGVVLGDLTAVSLTTSTQGLALRADASTTDDIFVTLFDPDNTGAAIDIATTTVKVCYTH